MKGHSGVVRQLLLKDPELANQRDGKHRLPIEFSIQKRHTDCVKEFLKRRPDLIDMCTGEEVMLEEELRKAGMVAIAQGAVQAGEHLAPQL